MPKNPFGLRNNEITVISDLTKEERGLKCNCLCIVCRGQLVAKMGNIKIYHFAHTKDACDETLLFIKGIFMFIELMINNEKTFYAPPLIATYRMPPPHISITMDNVEEYVKIKYKTNSLNDYNCLNGKFFNVSGVELKINFKNHAEALIVTDPNNHQLAIRILPPPNVCKSEKILPYEDFPTLICDTGDIDFNKDKREKIIDKLKNLDRWHWLKNQKIKKFYGRIIEHINEKQRKLENAKVTNIPNPIRKIVNTMNKPPHSKSKYENKIRSYNIRETHLSENKNEFRECSICGEIKSISEFGVYYSGGDDNKGKCKMCLNGSKKT